MHSCGKVHSHSYLVHPLLKVANWCLILINLTLITHRQLLVGLNQAGSPRWITLVDRARVYIDVILSRILYKIASDSYRYYAVLALTLLYNCNLIWSLSLNSERSCWPISFIDGRSSMTSSYCEYASSAIGVKFPFYKSISSTWLFIFECAVFEATEFRLIRLVFSLFERSIPASRASLFLDC